ncbi:MAG: class I SAM-dependent rRNA methyltransferase [Planctomycetota bacterium]|nr:class I SAM-dependent rRNA methyltransferase [Planctomycetota bacterium]
MNLYRRTPEKVESGDRLHPWIELTGPIRGPRVWSDDCGKCSERPQTGDLLAVYDSYGSYRGWALFHKQSRIRLRLVTRDEDRPTDDWWHQKAESAAKRRLNDSTVPNDVCRVINAEGDDFPALMVDRYGDTLVAVAYSSTMIGIFEMVLPTLHKVLGTKHHHLSSDPKTAKAEGDRPVVRKSDDCPELLRFAESEIKYEASLKDGHKTGFFCDQRDNRRRLYELIATMCEQQQKVEVLDVCSYTGGFGLQAARAGASAVHCIDLDEKAIAMGRRNVNINQLPKVKFTHADAFSYLRTLGHNQRQFDVVIVDPPKFISSRRDYEEGQGKYHDINKLAFPLVKPGGFIISCSCSGLFSMDDLTSTLRRAARARQVRIVRESGAGCDHPIRLDFPEGRYLKAVWMKLDD